MKYLYLIVAIILLMCLFPMPFGFYTLVRFVSMICFSYLAFDMYRRHNEGLMVTFIALAILFQPFCKIALGRTLWNVVDIMVAAFLIFLFFKIYHSKQK